MVGQVFFFVSSLYKGVLISHGCCREFFIMLCWRSLMAKVGGDKRRFVLVLISHDVLAGCCFHLVAGC